MKAEIVCIGTELLLGQILDTNAAFLAEELAGLGIDLYHKLTVGDNLERIVAALRQAWQRADLLILSGGLGPTQDDLTREAVAALLGEELTPRQAAWEQIVAYFHKMDRPYPESNRRQALFPASGQVIANSFGTAPALWVEREGRVLVALPGVPYELKGIWNESVRERLGRILAAEGNPLLTSRTIRMVGIGESAMEEQVIDLIAAQSNPTIAPYAGRGEVSLRITAKGFREDENWRLIDALTEKVRARLGGYIYGYDQDNLETAIGRLLRERGWRLALAESCTGGLMAHRITNVAGSSDYYLGGVNSYSNELKMAVLGVPESTLAEHGAVSPETARAMAAGIRRLTGAEVGLSATGIAGPGGGTAEKPVGLVYLGVDLPGYSQVERRIFPLDRIGNKESAAQAGLALLWQALRS
ncbi:competence/damage-inducible protein cinA [Hydrogenispora ethanolica]|uniref:Putative competence-damage inducible protein n=1 Tax=Hydrogenispora ethanolica TaxID=1082276 RepID=A0A4R1R948_HYDET|nr:competence/damage-inducible protein A [Hydrogenispora ethanolica]TCL62089.1 competence/damage-inducible protein cinA [Hydrogenispora ethanolica]